MSHDADAYASIGSRLRELREQHRYSLRGLAGKAGVSASLVSDIEKGKVEPSISTLKRLGNALSVNITYFFTEQSQMRRRVIRARERVVLDGVNDAIPDSRVAMEAGGIRFELASPPEAEAIEAIYGRYETGASLGDEPYTHEGEEWGMVLSGRLKVIVGDEIHFLEVGDSIWFPSTIPHRMENVADGPTEYIWIDSPKSF